MRLKNFEFKARVKDIRKLEEKLIEMNPLFIGEDNQTDTYFEVPDGRLKLREGKIENALIFYERQNKPDAKQSDVLLYKFTGERSLKEILMKTLKVRIIVEKIRRIYFIDNVKFHFDQVKDLGYFVEVEAIDNSGAMEPDKLKEQCDRYSAFFGLEKSDFVSRSYSDMVYEKQDSRDQVSI